MSPGGPRFPRRGLGFPRVSGDEPHANHVAVYLGGFSPRERG